MTPICEHNTEQDRCAECAAAERLDTLLWAWGCSVDSAPFPVLVGTDTACTVVAASRAA